MKSVIVVGAGPEALVCASYLAKSSLRVHVLEQRGAIGGRLGCLPGTTIPRCPLPLSGFEPHMPVGAILAELGISAPVFELHGEYRLLDLEQGRDLVLDTDPAVNDSTLGTGQSFRTLSERSQAYWSALMDTAADDPEPSPSSFLSLNGLPGEGFDTMAMAMARVHGLGEPSPDSALELLSLQQAQSPLFLPAKSVCALMHAFGELLGLFNGKVSLGQTVEAIRTNGKGWTVATGKGEHQADGLVLGVGPATAASLLQGETAVPLSEAVASIPASLTLHLDLQGDPGDLPMHTLLIPPAPLVPGQIEECLVTILDQELCPDNSRIISIVCRPKEYMDVSAPGSLQPIMELVARHLLSCDPSRLSVREAWSAPSSSGPSPFFPAPVPMAVAGPFLPPVRRLESCFLLARRDGLRLADLLS